MGGVASVPTDPHRKPEVICLGYQRTGTLSMALALEQLGYGPVAHGGSQMLGREDAYMRKLWHLYQVLDDKEALLKALRDITIGFGAIADAPYNMFAEELVELYPEAKFIYLTREVPAWWHSIQPVAAAARTWWLRYYNLVAPGWRWWSYIGDGFLRRYEELGLDAWTPKTLEQHKAYVLSHVPHDKLLIMSIKDGWKPLCEFLDKPEPNLPMPHANEAKSVAKLMPRAMLRVLGIWAILFTTLGVSCWGISRWIVSKST